MPRGRTTFSSDCATPTRAGLRTRRSWKRSSASATTCSPTAVDALSIPCPLRGGVSPVATTATGKSAMAETHPLALGVFGNWGQAVANEVVSNADTVLVVGSRLSPTDTCFENPELLDADRRTFLQIDVEPLQIGRHYPVSAAIVADAREALEALAAEVEERLTPVYRDAARRRREHLAELKNLHRYFAEPEQRSADMPLRPERVISELAARLGERALVTMDAGANRL